MSRPRKVRPSDFRRLADLVWKPGGVYDTWKAEGWPVWLVDLFHRDEYVFHSLGHRWELCFSVGGWAKCLEAAVGLSPGRLLSAAEVERLHSAGFYADMVALFRQLGFPRPWIGIRGNAHFSRRLRSLADIEILRHRFSELDLGPLRQEPETASIPRQESREALLEWTRNHRTSGWRLTTLEFQVKRFERAAGIRWGTRRDLILGLTSCCTWLHVFAPHSVSTRTLKALRKTGLFKKTAKAFEAIGHRGRWFPEYVKKRDRHTAEFWKPHRRGPLVSWNAFAKLLSCRLDEA
jgi:hypothetical protein